MGNRKGGGCIVFILRLVQLFHRAFAKQVQRKDRHHYQCQADGIFL